MKIKTAWAIQSLALCFLFNLAFTAVIFYMANRLIDASRQWVSALAASGAPAMPANAHTAIGGLTALIAQAQAWLGPVISVLASAFTLLLWFFLFLAGGKQMRLAESKVEGRTENVEGQQPDVGPASDPEIGRSGSMAGEGEGAHRNGDAKKGEGDQTSE